MFQSTARADEPVQATPTAEPVAATSAAIPEPATPAAAAELPPPEPLPQHAIARLGPARHPPAPVESVAFSPDGKLLASAGLDFAVRVWGVAGRGAVRALPVEVAPLLVAFSPDGRTLTAVTGRYSVHGFAAATGRPLGVVRPVVEAGAAGPPFALSPDLALLARRAGSRVTLWDLARDRPAGDTDPLPPEQPPARLAFSGDGKLLALAPLEGRPRIYQVQGMRLIRALGGLSARSLALSPDGRLLAVGTYGGLVSLNEAATGKEIRTLVHTNVDPEAPARVAALAFSADGKRLASWGSGGPELRVWDVETGRLLHDLAGHGKAAVRALAFSPDGRLLASAGADGAIILWELR